MSLKCLTEQGAERLREHKENINSDYKVSAKIKIFAPKTCITLPSTENKVEIVTKT